MTNNAKDQIVKAVQEPIQGVLLGEHYFQRIRCMPSIRLS
jgi:hypothetical protein